jgi:SAM-dependent methyltransferase
MVELRRTFDRSASDYEAIRPGYPAELFEDIVNASAVPPGGRILEVGCGTGQATLPFAARGYAMLCLDIGEKLVAVAKQKCAPYPQVSFEITSFEEWPPEGRAFDLLISATAFHWIPPEIGYPKAAQALKEAGHLALFWNYHPEPMTGFFEAVQPIYRRLTPEWPAPQAGMLEERIKGIEATINSTGLFTPAQIKRYRWRVEYTTAEYLRLLNTYSPHLSLPEERRQRLYQEIGELIESEFHGVVERSYLTVLYMAQRSKESRL